MARRLREVLPRTDGIVLVVEDAGAVVGWTHLIGCYRLEEDVFGEIAGLVVAETHRGRGAGAQLLEAAENWARERAYHRVLVRSNVIRERAHTFYEREGYTPFKRQAVFAKPLRVP